MVRRIESLGYWGEARAMVWLEKRGYRIIEHQYRCKCGEIDIVAEACGILVFVEVKTRNSDFGILPCQSVNEIKQTRIKNTASHFIAYSSELADNGSRLTRVDTEISGYRFDVVEIIKAENKAYIRHLVNAF